MSDNYAEALRTFISSINYEISMKTDPLQFHYMMQKALEGKITDQELAELKGYYAGLKVAREIMQRSLCQVAETDNTTQNEEEPCKSCLFKQECSRLTGKDEKS